MAHYNPIIDDPGFETDLITAASYGDCSRMLQILSNPETKVDERNANGWTALMYASHYGHYQVVDELIKVGCDVNLFEPSSCRTALMMAASNGHTYCVERLVHSSRVNLKARDRNGLTAADLAQDCGHGRNTALVRALQIEAPKAIIPHQSQERTYLKSKPGSRYNRDSGNTTYRQVLPTTTPHQSLPLNRRLFPTPSSTPIHGSDTPTSNLGFADQTAVDNVSPFEPADLTLITSPLTQADNASTLEQFQELQVLQKRIKELEGVIKVFHAVTKQIIIKCHELVPQ